MTTITVPARPLYGTDLTASPAFAEMLAFQAGEISELARSPFEKDQAALRLRVHADFVKRAAGAFRLGIVADMVMLMCPDRACGEFASPDTLGEAIGWALGHKCGTAA